VPRIVSRARQLRLDYAAYVGRPVELKEVAATVGMTEAALSRLERGKTERIDFDTLEKIITFYNRVLDRRVTAADVLDYDPNHRWVSELQLA
jgi:DNA-binding Xre family transcriptional regulator